MFYFAEPKKSSSSKCYVTHGTMGHLNPKQPPVKRKPYVAVLSGPFISRAELILPKELYDVIQDDLIGKFTTPTYSEVILSLEALVESNFLDAYIRKGDCLMLSEGTRGVDNVYFLRDGILTLTLDKESYERAGLVGKPDGVKGNRGTKPRWIVEINLRLPSMFHGKKGFDRIVYAFKNVLTANLRWFFIDLRAQALGLRPDPILQYHPLSITCPPKISPAIDAEVPHLQPPKELKDKYSDDFSDFAVDVYEWLSLVSLESPRIEIDDQIDHFLSRYTRPESDSGNAVASKLIRITWEGFLAPSWAHNSFVNALPAAATKHWFSFTVSSFNEDLSRDRIILKLPGTGNEYIMWEIDEV